MTPLERIERFIKRTDRCWLWTGGKCGESRGLPYGKFKMNGKQWQAHRAAYVLFRGPIPDNLPLDHLCRNTLCVNPDHLDPVTIAENNARGVSIQAMNARKQFCVRGHPFSGANLIRIGKRRRCRECARERNKKCDSSRHLDPVRREKRNAWMRARYARWKSDPTKAEALRASGRKNMQAWRARKRAEAAQA